jgi:hypothetical protein
MTIDKLNSNDANTCRGPLEGNDEPLLQSTGTFIQPFQKHWTKIIDRIE